MDSLSSLVSKFNPGLNQSGVDEMLSYYQFEVFEADWSETRPNVRGDIYEERGYTRLDTGEYIVPNTVVGPFSISVANPVPSLLVDYDVVGSRSLRGRTNRVNLFNNRAGWRWTSNNPPRLARSKQRTTSREGEVLISVDDGRDHYYTLAFDTGSLDGVLYTKPTRGEPRNRPSVRGRLVLGSVVGTIQTLASKKTHPVFDSISVVATDRDGLEPLRRSK
jgi:hypothetical protein